MPLSMDESSRRGAYECVKILLEAGADPNCRCAGMVDGTPFNYAVVDGQHRLWPLFLRAGADIPRGWRRDQEYYARRDFFKRSNIRANASPAFAVAACETTFVSPSREPSRAERFEYLRTIEEAGGFKAYEKAHARALAATLAKNFPARIPEEIFPRIVAYWAHTGFYVSAAAVAANPRTQGRLKSR